MQSAEKTCVRSGPRRTFAGAAWAIIVLATAILMVMAARSGSGTPDGGLMSGPNPLLEIEARLVMAQESLAPGTGKALLDDVLAKSPPGQTLRLSGVAALLFGPDSARQILREVQQRWASGTVEPTEAERSILKDLDRLFAGEAGEAVVSRVESTLGWFGRLAVIGSEQDEQQRNALRAPIMAAASWMMLQLVFVLMVLGGLAVVGLVMLVLAIVWTTQGVLHSRLSLLARHDGVYAETFAVWLIGFSILMVFAAVVAGELPATLSMSVTFVAFILSLAALAWPVYRGVAWSRVRTDIGWTRGEGVLREFGCGLIGYMAAIPIAGVGLLISMMLILFTAPDEGAAAAAHPIVNELAGGGWWMRIQVLMVASIAAPIVEETMFRGVLYRQVRSCLSGWSTWAAIAASAGVTSLIFALIHPQGLLAVPALMALAIAFCLAREWRGSVIAPMVMHGVSNGIVMTMLMLMT